MAVRSTSGSIHSALGYRYGRRSGIETVYQDKALAEQQTVMRNLFMGREITGPLGLIRLGRERAEAEALMRRIGFTSKLISPDSIVATLSGGEREGVAIARAMYFQAELIILDEPTQALSLQAQVVLNFVVTPRAKQLGHLHHPQRLPRLRGG
jgi:simple sugar transport system ATP-binding protein